jgi:RHS repeat-associated protein
MVLLAVGLLFSGSLPVDSIDRLGVAAETLPPIDPLTPTEHGQSPIDGLQYADPTEALGIIGPPVANNEGTAGLSYPIDVPPGHGITPELAVSYDSSGGNSWLGMGWDLSVGAIGVDTSFGAPHFDPDSESESYVHDGDLLVPNAIGGAWEPRVPTTRRDYTHQVETEYAEIIRHVVNDGGPDDYFWEVRGKDGGVKWYGATPDSGGPVPSTTQSVPTIDEDAVVRDADGNIVRWLLSAQRDIGVNLIRYEYETVRYTFSGGAWVVDPTCDATAAVCGQHTYLDRVLYTDATSAITDFNGPPYEIDFIRESEMPGNSGSAAREDPMVNARLGYLDVIVDRLARVEVSYGNPPVTGTTRTYDQTAARYTFAYATGWFGKSLLSSITQGVDDLHVHTLMYHNDLGTPNANVAGFATPADWTSTDDVASQLYLDEDADVSTLGGSETNAGSGNIYIGFNPVVPSKVGSFGGGFELSGGDTTAIAEWIDLNGDSLPDKVFTSSSGVSFRLNTSGPSGSGFATGPPGTATDLPGLSKNSNFAFQISAEAYPIVALGVGTGLSFSWSSSYFSDVNADGLVDFVSGGQVHFNRLVNGIPIFSTSSALTPVPLDPAPLPVLDSAELDEIDQAFRTQSPPIDTVRRFTAPFDGTIEIDAPVSLDTLGLATTNGVRVAVQHEGSEIASAELGTSTSAFSTPITRTVSAGDHIYFRLGAIEDGVADSVNWDPTITYTGVPWGDDANGLSQTTYKASADFTLAGRPDNVAAMPFTGTARVDATVTISAALTDDVTLTVVRHDASLNSSDQVGTSPTEVPVTSGTVPRGMTGTFPLTVTVDDVDVTEASTSSDQDGDGQNDTVVLSDRIEVYLAVDSPVDLSQIDWDATITYDGATGAAADFEQIVRPHTEFYPSAYPTTAATLTSLPDTFTAVLSVDALASNPGNATAVVTFKNANGTVNSSHAISDNGEMEFDVDLTDISGAGYFVDISVRDGIFSRNGLVLTRFDRYTDPGKTTSTAIDGRLRWTGMQGIFPLAYRGWAVAGYTAPDSLAISSIDATAFDIVADANTPVTEPARADISLDQSGGERSYAFIPAPQAGATIVQPDGTTTDSRFGTGGDAVPTDRWIGPRSSIYADADTMQTSRLVADVASITDLGSGAPGTGDRTAPTRLGIGGPGLTLLFGVGPLGASAGLSPSFGITDFEDLNGDGYPDVISAGSVSYTNQTGGYLDSRGVAGTAVTNQDLTFSINGGLGSGLVDIVPNPKGGTNATHGNAAGKGSSASDAGPSYSLGISGSGGFSWTSPNASGTGDDATDTSTYGDQRSSLEADSDDDSGGAIQRAFADVNGDGLADNVFTTAQGVFAFYNLGYGFTDKAVQLGAGGFESRESANGGLGLGFSLPYGEFGGGVNLLWNYDWSRYSWRDVNGDGILDQLHRIGESDVKVAFGTGSGLLAPIDYGDLANVELVGLTTSGQHVSFDRSSGIGGGVSATGYIGPLCLVACYLVIGGGGGYNNSRSSTSTDVEDVNGDGFADVLKSLDDSLLQVSVNQQGRTNLLASVTNPLGGSFTLDYTRDGNTTDHPNSIWTLTEVVIDDGRDDGGASDGDDITKLTFAYDGLEYDRTHRASLGYSSVIATEVDDSNNALRITEQTYLNDNVFVAGLLTEVTTLNPTGLTPVRGSTVTWGFRDVRAIGSDFDPRDPIVPVDDGSLGETTTVASRGRSIAPMVTAHSEYWYDSGGRTFERVIEYTYDGLGNVLVERDLGDGTLTSDDRFTSIGYSDCTNSTSNGCLDSTSAYSSPLSGPGTCVNWASYPGQVVVRGVDNGGTLYTLRERSGFAALCDNGAVTEERIVVDDTGTEAVTDVTLNQYGDYALVMSPPGQDGERYTVRYTYDADRHTDVAMVEEFDVATARAAAVLASGPDPLLDQVGISSQATFDVLSGRVASRTDANGATRHYTYDELGRPTEISKMAVGAATPTPLVTFEYNANDPNYAHAIARHVDDFDGNNPAGTNDAAGEDTTATIDSVTFVDGLGRVTQTKRDARIVAPGQSTTTNSRQVTGSVAFDQLARPVIEYGPVADDGPADGFTTASFGGKQTTREYDITDRVTEVVEPGARTTTFEYAFERPDLAGPILLTVLGTDPELREITRGADIRGNQRVHIDSPAPRPGVTPPPDLVTTFDGNAIGETLQVTDPTGAVTSFEFDLRGNTVSVTTPNSGQTTFAWDPAGRRVERVNERMRANGTQTQYRYDLDRLVTVDHPGIVDDVTYQWGLDNADGRFTAGRIRHLEDRTRLADNSYGATGALVGQLVEVKRHNWDPTLTEAELEEFRWTTAWTYDELGRVETIRYPDAKTVDVVPTGISVASLTDPAQLATLLQQVDLPGELVTYDYDSGGMVRNISGVEPGIVLVQEPIDQFNIDLVQTTVMVPRPTDHNYDYLLERVYDHRLLAMEDSKGNGTVTARVYDIDTKWLSEIATIDATGSDVQDITYSFDAVGRPLTYENDLPFANRAINGGAISQSYNYDGFGRLVAASGSFRLKQLEEQRYTYGVAFKPAAPWNLVTKDQTDQLVTTKPNGRPGQTTVNEATTYSVDRTLGTTTGPLHAGSDDRTDAEGEIVIYEYTYNVNGGIESMLASEDTSSGQGGGPGQQPSEPNVWDRTFTWNQLDQLTSADDGSELRTFAYDDAGNLTIQDGNLLADDGTVLHQSGGGPETIFLNQWVTIRSQKIYKHVWAGDDQILAKMDADADFESKQLYRHYDLVGSTNIVTDDQGRGYQRHEYLPSGEIWIDDRKEEIRTPFQFSDGYYEDEFDIVLFGPRWYDTERELFLSPDPVLVNDVGALIDQPALGGAYTYAGANGAGNVDPSGQTFFSGHQRAEIVAKAETAFELEVFGMRLARDDDGAQAALDQRAKDLASQDRAELLQTNALLIIDLQKQEISFGLPYGDPSDRVIRRNLPGRAADVGDKDKRGGPEDDFDASDEDGRPDAGGDGAAPGSTTIDTSDDELGDVAGSESDSDSLIGDVDAVTGADGDGPDGGVGKVVNDARTDD